MSDNDIKTICEKIESLQEKILKSKFAETVTESEMLCLILAVRGLNDQKAEIEKLQEVNADLNESLRLAAEANKDLKAEIEEKVKTAKAEAIKEFAVKLKETPIKLGLPLLGLLTKSEIEDYFNRTLLQVRDAIDNLVAEMTEGE